MRRALRIGLALLAAGGLLAAGLFAEVALFGLRADPGPADAAIVLGAAVYGDVPSPVFAERIRHAADLQKAGTVRLIVTTGGLAAGDRVSEAEAAKAFAVAEGVPAADILVEDRSRTTEENLANALPLLAAHGIARVLVVSDPPHMRRALAIARQLGMDAYPAPTPTSLYTGWRRWGEFVAAETWFLARCRLRGRC